MPGPANMLFSSVQFSFSFMLRTHPQSLRQETSGKPRGPQASFILRQKPLGVQVNSGFLQSDQKLGRHLVFVFGMKPFNFQLLLPLQRFLMQQHFVCFRNIHIIKMWLNFSLENGKSWGEEMGWCWTIFGYTHAYWKSDQNTHIYTHRHTYLDARVQ